MKKVLLFLLIFLFSPAIVSAACSGSGSSVVYINGIWTTEDQAREQLLELQNKFQQETHDYTVHFYNGYNPTHLAGLGDLVESLAQEFGKSISDYDLNTILLQIYPQVETRRLLLVGHSQGSFYTDDIYTYLTAHGEPKEALGVYNVATPGSSVGGGGKYLNSKEDTLLDWARSTLHFNPLPANIDIPITAQDAADNSFAGHSFEEAYLAGAPGRIISDISNELAELQPADASPNGDCFDPPPQTLAYDAEGAAFALADPAAQGLEAGSVATYKGVVAIASTATALARAAGGAVATIFDTVTGAEQSVGSAVANNPNNPAAPQNTPANFAVFKALYGSSLSPSDVKELLNSPGASQGGAAALALPALTTITDTSATTSTTTATSTMPKSFSFAGGGGGGAALASLDNDADATASSSDESAATADDTATTTDETASATPAVLFTASTTPPALTIAECAYSLAQDGCLIATTSATLSWSAPEGAVSFSITLNGASVASTAATSTKVTLPDNASSAIAVIAYDASSTPLSSASQSAYAASQPMVINEIAWGGTAASPDDQWIEIKRTAPFQIDLSHVALVAEEGGSQYIPLSGNVPNFPPSEYPGDNMAIIENSASAVPSALAPIVAAFDPLAPSGEQLALVWQTSEGTTTLDETPPIGACGGWCAGTALAPIGTSAVGAVEENTRSMERGSAEALGTAPSNWHSNDAYTTMGSDRYGTRIVGTPGIENSAGLPDFGWYCDPDTQPVAEGASYHQVSDHCTYLTRFITYGQLRASALFQGTVGSSTLVADAALHTEIGSSNRGWYIQGNTVYGDALPPGDTPAGAPYFVAAWEARVGIPPNDPADAASFVSWFTTGHRLEGNSITGYFPVADTDPPHTNYRVLHWTYQP